MWSLHTWFYWQTIHYREKTTPPADNNQKPSDSVDQSRLVGRSIVRVFGRFERPGVGVRGRLQPSLQTNGKC